MPQQEYFADGMTEALITDLAQMKGLRVISRTSSMAYKAQPQKTLPEIARELDVDLIVEGSVIRDWRSRARHGTAHRRHARRAPVGEELRPDDAETSSRSQGEVATAIANEVTGVLATADASRLVSRARHRPRGL